MSFFTDLGHCPGGDQDPGLAPRQAEADPDDVRPVFEDGSRSRRRQRRRQKTDASKLSRYAFLASEQQLSVYVKMRKRNSFAAGLSINESLTLVSTEF